MPLWLRVQPQPEGFDGADTAAKTSLGFPGPVYQPARLFAEF